MAIASPEEFNFVERYIKQSHGATHIAYTLDLDTLYRIDRHDKGSLQIIHTEIDLVRF